MSTANVERAPAVECRSCQAPIFWAATLKTGKPIPLNYHPDVEGNVRIERGEAFHGRYQSRAVTLGPIEATIARAEGVELFMPHHATCPDAAAWKGPR